MRTALKAHGMYAAGIGFLALAWAKNRLSGYSTPNTVARGDVAGAIDYVHDTVDSWLRFLDGVADVRGLDVLELCPGSTLGTGALLLARGARSYHAVDAFRLADPADADFLLQVLTGLDPERYRREDVARARSIVESGDSELFGYAVERDFDIERLAGGKSFDLVVSCAAFEHYDDIDRTIEQISAVARPGCVSAQIVDFQTHSRWIRENDPNNIYRYGDGLYGAFAFPGQPNRKRPADYVAAFTHNGWGKARVLAAQSLDPGLVELSTTGLLGRYSAPDAMMSVLAGVVVAERRAKG